jgi:DNA-binding SARP family transcriptional activator
MLSVRMFGVFTISLDGARIDELGPSGRGLSGYLFEFIGKVHRRERLADQFWGHLDAERARAALNTALWRFRKLLTLERRSDNGQNLRTTGSEVVLEPAPWLDIDTHQFGTAVKRLLSVQDSANNACLSELEAAVETYAGPFLDGDDGEWILEERERLHSLYVRAMIELMRCYARLNRWEEAIAAARRILADDPFRESVHRDLLLLYVLNGQRGDALRHHEHWSVLLRQELCIGPMPETVRLTEVIRSGQVFDQLDALKAHHLGHVVPTTAAAPGITSSGVQPGGCTPLQPRNSQHWQGVRIRGRG